MKNKKSYKIEATYIIGGFNEKNIGFNHIVSFRC